MNYCCRNNVNYFLRKHWINICEKKRFISHLALPYFSSDVVYSAAVTHRTLPSFSIRNFRVLDTTFARGVAPRLKFRGEIYGVATAIARSWNFLNDALLELVVRERAKGRNLTRPEVMLYYISLALAVSTPRDNRSIPRTLRGCTSLCICFP